MAADLDAVRAGACDYACRTIYAPYHRHAPECRADDILELADELERLRGAVALHHLLDVAPVPGVVPGVVFPCSHCGHPWPCPTVTTAEGGGH